MPKQWPDQIVRGDRIESGHRVECSVIGERDEERAVEADSVADWHHPERPVVGVRAPVHGDLGFRLEWVP
jgi:hypothetical protein